MKSLRRPTLKDLVISSRFHIQNKVVARVSFVILWRSSLPLYQIRSREGSEEVGSAQSEGGVLGYPSDEPFSPVFFFFMTVRSSHSGTLMSIRKVVELKMYVN